jgi:hypothetical protein
MKLFALLFSSIGLLQKAGEPLVKRWQRLKRTGTALTVGGGGSLALSLTDPSFVSEITVLVQALITLVGAITTLIAAVKENESAPPSSAGPAASTLMLLFILLFSSAMIQETQAAIITKVQTEVPDIVASSIPANPETYQLAAGKAAVLVMYDGITARESQAQGGKMQPAGMRWTLFVKSRVNYAGAPGELSCIAILDTLREKLQGFVPDATRPHEFLEFVSEDFDFQKNGVWTYAQTWNQRKILFL